MPKYLTLIILLGCLNQSLFSQSTITWDGDTNTDWNTASNWDGDVIPTSSDHVVIPDHTSALTFDGVDDGVSVTGLTAYSEMTIEAWIKVDALISGYMSIVDFAFDSPFFGFQGNNLIIFLNGVEANVDFTSYVGTWTHVSVTIASGDQKLYINGSEVTYGGLGPGTKATVVTGTSFGIGYNGTDNAFDGSISEVRIWNSVRTDTELSTHYNKSLSGNEDDLVAFYTFASGQGTELLDYSGNNNTGNFSGLPTWSGVRIDGEQSCNNLTLGLSSEVFMESGASLEISGSVSGSGQVSIERNTTGNSGYSIIGSPISSLTSKDLHANFVYSHDGTSFSSNLKSSSTALTPGQGFFVSYAESSPTLRVLGTPNSGTIHYPISTTGFHLVANPYNAAIDIEDFLSGNTIDDGTVYFWSDGGSNVGSDRGGDYISTNGLGTANSETDTDGVAGIQGTTAAENGNITSVQGVFINVPTTTGNITFTPSMQTSVSGANDDANHYRKEEFQKIKLSLEGENLYNDILIGLGDGATFGKDDGLDALKRSGNPDISFSSMIDSEQFSIQAIPQVDMEPVTVPLLFTLSTAGDYTINVKKWEGFKNDISIILHDEFTGKNYEISESFSLSFVTNVTENDRRFSITFSPKHALSLDDLTKQLSVYGTREKLQVQYPVEGLHQTKICTIDGKTIYKEHVNFTNEQAIINIPLIENKLYILYIDNHYVKFALQ